jgi:hypothetical protein
MGKNFAFDVRRAIRILSRGRIRILAVFSLWQSNGKVKKLSCVL